MRCLLCQEDIMVGEHFGLEYKNYIHAKTGINVSSSHTKLYSALKHNLKQYVFFIDCV